MTQRPSIPDVHLTHKSKAEVDSLAAVLFDSQNIAALSQVLKDAYPAMQAHDEGGPSGKYSTYKDCFIIISTATRCTVPTSALCLSTVFRQVCHHAGSLDFGIVTAAAGYLRMELDFYIFGFDVIIERGTGVLCILDM